MPIITEPVQEPYLAPYLEVHRPSAVLIKVSCLWNTIPYGWDKRRGRVTVCKSKLKISAFLLNFILMVVYEIYLLYRVIQTFMLADSTVTEVVKVTYNAALYMFPLALQVNVILRWHQIPALVNAYLTTFQQFKDRFYLHGTKQPKNGCEKILKGFRFVTIPIIAQNVVQILKTPSSAIYFTSLLPNAYITHLKYRLPLMIIHWQIWMTICSVCMIVAGILYLYAFPTVYILQEMVMSNRPGRDTHESLRTPGSFMQWYRTLQVQHAKFHHCFQHFLLPWKKAILGGGAVLGIYGAIKIPGPRAMSMAMVAAALLLDFNQSFGSLARIRTASERVLESWRGRDKYLRKFIRSCRPLNVYVSSAYTVSRTTFLVVFGVIVNATITLLLT